MQQLVGNSLLLYSVRVCTLAYGQRRERVLERFLTLFMHGVLQASSQIFLEIGGDFRQVNKNLPCWQVPNGPSDFLRLAC